MTPANSMKAYATAAVSLAEDGERILALWRQGLTHRDMPGAKLDWYYRHNPEGTPIMTFLLHGDARELAGVAAAGPRRMRYGSRTLRAGAMVDFVVVPAHRTLFPAMFLQKAICRQALEAYAFLFGIPNPKAMAAVQRAGYRFIGPLVRRVRILRSATYLSRLLPAWLSRIAGPALDRVRLCAPAIRKLAAPGFRTEWLDRPDSRFDDLWERSVVPDVLSGARDSAFLAWRFVDCPLNTHRFFAVVSKADGRLAAYAACEARGKALRVRDFLVDPARPAAWTRLWAELPLQAYTQGHESVSVDFLGAKPAQRRLAAAGFLERGQQPVYAVLPPELAELSEQRRWYLTGADDDA